MTITIYTKPDCGPCLATKHALAARGIPFNTVDLTADPEALARVTRMGYRSAPVVIVSESEHWSGFDLARITDLAERMIYAGATQDEGNDA
ncbi:ribonucleoside-diphosphate reductase class Ib glutaredoxin subunit [Paracoccus alcaliphilus]|uniref:Ribonucleoside-diphosphate reductase class Ib glutaredoxin subunit n=1 Tax=Paracoccus alcaliphilus TaxID=34002 RepID=A0A1H8K3F3_9RHOB|nr:glutaredoxin family protein [Paracoccus alcaliphilus]WCR17523.1 glutaredoxin family protein [Paracoccus alcaliphilus]SEN87321.1 ribonucleoside-diphosphate reductase class Ib glutaredoxin subunit [Paracoccus alcaliphilus]